eukprot:Rmarinus@m.5157
MDNCKIISVFNHKGGVGKTSLTTSVAWKLASEGKKVLVVDADPQCNLTGFLLDPGYELAREAYAEDHWPIVADPLCQYYQLHPATNVYHALAPLLDRPACNEANIEFGGPLGTRVFRVRDRLDLLPHGVGAKFQMKVPLPPEQLFILPGHPKFGEYESKLVIACEQGCTSATAAFVPGCFLALVRQIQRAQQEAGSAPFDFIIYDMSPGATCINKLLLMTSDYFYLPCTMEFFSEMAVRTLCQLIPEWICWFNAIVNNTKSQLSADSSHDYVVWEKRPILLGRLFQMYKVNKAGEPTKAYQSWKDQIDDTMISRLIPTLGKYGMSLPLHVYDSMKDSGVQNLVSLAAIASRLHCPVFAVTNESYRFASGATADSYHHGVRKSVDATFTSVARLFENPTTGLSARIIRDAHQRQLDVTRVMAIPLLRNRFAEMDEKEIRKWSREVKKMC